MTRLKKFTGFKGKIVFAQIDNVPFVIMTANARQLEALWPHVMPEAGPLEPSGVKNAILIEAATLPDAKPVKPSHVDAIDRVEQQLASEESAPAAQT